jgi:3-dehydroquinate synthase
MIKLNINLSERGYPIYITDCYRELSKVTGKTGISGKICVITDKNVAQYQYGDFVECLEEYNDKIYKYVIEPGEKSKNLDTVRDIYRFLVQNRFDRNSAIVALGGGVVGDISGFVAATFLRGIKYIQVPTSLLAQADSSVGGKTGVDFEGSKNMVGAFYQPIFVFVNVSSLKTLPDNEIRTGLAETLKHGLIMDPDFFEYVDYNIERLFNRNTEVLLYIAKMNCTIKGRVVEQDETEQGLRAVLNLGHTIGHAIESMTDFSLSHGECVSIGINGAFRLATLLEMVDEYSAVKVCDTLCKAGLPLKMRGLDVEKVYRQMFYDKKVNAGRLKFVLPKRIGEVVQCTVDDEELIKSVLYEISEE